MTRSRCCILLLTSVALGSCAREDVERSIEESAGASSWQVGSVPSILIGSEEEEEYEFSTIVGLGKLSSGQWYLFDRASNELRFYDEHGRFIRRVGRNGEGPGEFRYVLFAGSTAAGNILIHDALLRRLTAVEKDGTVLNTMRVPDQPEGGSVLLPIGMLDAHTFVWSSFKTPACVEGVTLTDTITYFRVYVGPEATPRGNRPLELVPIATMPGGQRWGNAINVLKTCLANPIPFVGVPSARVHDGSLYISTPDQLGVLILDVATGIEKTVGTATPRRPLTASLIESYVERTLGSTARDEMGRPLTGSPGAQEYEERLRAMPYPDSLPVSEQLVVDLEGNVWVGSYPLDESEPVEWWIFSPNGGQAERVLLPARFRVMEIGEDYIAGVTSDEFGVQRVAAYDLVRPSRTAK